MEKVAAKFGYYTEESNNELDATAANAITIRRST